MEILGTAQFVITLRIKREKERERKREKRILENHHRMLLARKQARDVQVCIKK